METVESSAEYQAACRAVDEQNAQLERDAITQTQLQLALDTKTYEEQTFPTYEQSLVEYETELVPSWNEESLALDNAISETKAALQEVYDRNIIPGSYRNLNAMTYIAAFMGTSNYDLITAIERYDKSIDQLLAREGLSKMDAQIQLAGQMLGEMQFANYLQTQTHELLESGNDLLRETRNWTAANTAMHAYDIAKARSREKRLEQRRA